MFSFAPPQKKNSFFDTLQLFFYPMITIYRSDDTRKIESGYPDLIPLSETVTILVWALKGPQEISWLICLLAFTTLWVYTEWVTCLTYCYCGIRLFFKYNKSCCRFRLNYFHIEGLNISKTDRVCLERSFWFGGRREVTDAQAAGSYCCHSDAGSRGGEFMRSVDVFWSECHRFFSF